MGPRAGLDGCGNSRSHRDLIPGPSSPQRVAIPTELSRPKELRVAWGKRDVRVRKTESRYNVSLRRTAWSRGHFYYVCITDKTDYRLRQDAQAATALWVGVTATGEASRGFFNGGPSRRNNSTKELQNFPSNCRQMTSAHTTSGTAAQNMYQSVAAVYRRWDSSVSSVTGLQTGQQRNYGSPAHSEKDLRIWSLTTVQIGLRTNWAASKAAGA
jgi:hypothetical protein